MQSQTTFSLSFWISSTRTKNNQVSIYARIPVNGKRANISLKRRVVLSEWDSNKGRAKGIDKDLFIKFKPTYIKNEFYINREEVMGFSKIGSKSTYHKCVKERNHYHI